MFKIVSLMNRGCTINGHITMNLKSTLNSSNDSLFLNVGYCSMLSVVGKRKGYALEFGFY